MRSRRDFVKRAGIAAAGAAILPACGTPGKQQEAAEGSGTGPATAELRANWRVGLQLYTLRGAMMEGVKETIDYVAQVGYDEVELFGYQNGQYFGRSAADFYKLVENAGMSIRSAHYGSGRTNPETVGSMSNGWDKAIEDAVAAGQSHMVCAYLQESERQTLDQYKEFADLCNEAGSKCKEAGLTFAYHNHAFEFEEIDGQVPMYYLLDNTDPELVKMELDLFWIAMAGYDPLEFFKKYPGRTELWHVKDLGERDGEQTTVEVGNGSIDFESIFAESANSGLQAFFVEQDHSPDPKSSVSTSFNNLKQILA